jgi:hypothetical protein
MNVMRRLLSNWLAIGLLVTILVLLVTRLVRQEKSMMASSAVPLQVSFLGSKTSEAGFSVVTDITYEKRESKEWPYLAVTIFSQNGDRLYQSAQYAAWFEVKLCWDDADRLWIASTVTGTDVIASTPNGWRRHRWMADASTKTMIDAESGERLGVVDWQPPHPITGDGDEYQLGK